MCGIAGIGGLGHLDLVQRMSRRLIHRGPDAEGYLVRDGKVSLGSRRLKIIDLETGDMPISNEDGSVWTVLNGEIYNYVELRAELEKKGHQFKTHTDTEVIVHLYEEKGEYFLQDLRGMFALAVWDEKNEKLIIARDRFGIKPLYYAMQGGCLYFASEIKSLLEVPGLSRDLDDQGLLSYFSYLYIPQPLSIFKSIKKLPPAHYGLYRRGEWVIRKYWKLSLAVSKPVSFSEAKDKYLHLFRESVTQHLRTDVPWGIFLSGGMDSSSVAAMVREVSKQDVHTFNIAFREMGFDESGDARRVAAHLGTKHEEFVLDSAESWILPELTKFFDEPFADSSAIPTYYVSQMARTKVTVALSGEGGDDTLSGYGWHLDALRMMQTTPAFLKFVLTLFSEEIRSGMIRSEGKQDGLSKLSRYLYDRSSDAAALYFRKLTVPGAHGLNSILNRSFQQSVDTQKTYQDFRRKFQESGLGASLLNQLLAFEVAQPMTDDLLVKVDRMSMAHSLEVRVPLLDHKLVEYAFSLPDHFKLHGGTTKWILREAMKDKLPPSLKHKAKHGFSIPIADWLRQGWKQQAEQLFSDPSSRMYQFLDHRAVMNRWQEHQDGRRNWGFHLWSMMVLEQWCRAYKI